MQNFWNWLAAQDQNLFLTLNHFLNQIPGLEYILGWPTYLGQPQYLLPLTVIFLFFWDRAKWFQVFMAVLAAFVVSYGASEFLKELIGRDRPFTALSSAITHFDLPISKAFPSGHVVVMTCVTFVLNQIYKNKLLWTYIFIPWIALTRVYIGVHYPFDLAGGFLLGLAGGWIALWGIRKWTTVLEQ